MCDDSETVINMSLEKEGDEIEPAPTLSKGRIASSVMSALPTATHFAQTVAMPEIQVVCDLQPRILEGWTMQDRILNKRGSSVKLAAFLHLLSVLLFDQSTTQNIDKDTFHSHMHLIKDAFITLGLDTTRIDEIEKLSEEYSPPARKHELKEKLKRGKGAAVKFKQIDKIEHQLAVFRRKLADVESSVKCVQTSMEGLVSEMKAIKAEIAMQTEIIKDPPFAYSGIPDHEIPRFIRLLDRLTVHPLLQSFVDETKRTDKGIGAIFPSAKLKSYYLKIKRFAKAFKRFVAGRLFGAFSNYWKKGSLSSLVNDKLFRRVVEVLSKAERFLRAIWRGKESLFENRCETAGKEAKKRQCMAAKRKSPDTEETMADVKKFRHSWSIPRNKKHTTNDSKERSLPIVKVHDEKAEEQSLALPLADRDPLRLELCEPQDVLIQLQDDQQLEQASLQNPETDTKDLETSERQAVSIPSSVQDALLSKSSDAQEVVNRLQEELQKEQSSLKHPDPKTKKTIRCVARKAKCLSKLDVVKRLREVTPAGTTGPLLPESLDVLDISHEQIRELSVNLCGGDEWIIVAERLGLTPAEIRLLEKRCLKPFKKALKYSRRQQYWNVGQLYDVLVDCGFPIFAELL